MGVAETSKRRQRRAEAAVGGRSDGLSGTNHIGQGVAQPRGHRHVTSGATAKNGSSNTDPV